MKHWKDLSRMLRGGIFLVAGDGFVSQVDQDPVHVGIAYEITSFGPHPAAIYVDQTSYSTNVVVEAYEELLNYLFIKYKEDEENIEDEISENIEDEISENIDGVEFTMSAAEFIKAVKDTKTEQFITIFTEDDHATNSKFTLKDIGDILSNGLGEVEVLVDIFAEPYERYCFSVARADIKDAPPYYYLILDTVCKEREVEEGLLKLLVDHSISQSKLQQILVFSTLAIGESIIDTLDFFSLHKLEAK